MLERKTYFHIFDLNSSHFLTGVIEEEVFFVRYIDNGQPVTRFLSLQPEPSGDAAGIKKALHNALAELDLPLCMEGMASKHWH